MNFLNTPRMCVLRVQYLQSSSAMSVCGIRHQYSLLEHVKMSLFASEFLCDIEDYLGLNGNKSNNNFCFWIRNWSHIATDLVLLLLIVELICSKKAQGSIVSNWIGMKFGRIVSQVNMYWLTNCIHGIYWQTECLLRGSYISSMCIALCSLVVKR